jgi:hypothetical protein
LSGAATESVAADKKLAIFDKIFSAYHDARSCIRNDLVCNLLFLFVIYLVQTNILDNRDVLYNGYGLYSNIFFSPNVGFCWQC